MSWLIRKRKPKTRPATAAGKMQRRTWDPSRTLRAIELLVATTTLTAVILGWGSLERALTHYAGAHATSSSKELRVHLADVPSWMSVELRDRVARIVAQQAARPDVHPDNLAHAVRSLEADPWVRAVERIQRADDQDIILWARYRQPVAVVETTTGYCLVDDQAVRVADTYRLDQLRYVQLPLVTGVASPPPREGFDWPGDDLRAGLELVRLLADRPYLSQIRAFDVSGRDPRNRIHLILRTAQGCVRWGLPPGHEVAIEPDATVKLRRLDEVYQQRGTIDAGSRTVDIYGAAVFIHPSDEPAQTRYVNRILDRSPSW